ncbi:unnamed protein product [Prunus armeniaca]|uniref:Uncharacterized protein n=1 Tax=Prunus armeniaca TaxID=36596 RepID=A0A6J5U390_PRUAR|nr:unnamed protein product [Prunus armeniaca]CAB4301059.1 unnamed protein product [Prunus armeniaca]
MEGGKYEYLHQPFWSNFLFYEYFHSKACGFPVGAELHGTVYAEVMPPSAEGTLAEIKIQLGDMAHTFKNSKVC